MTYLMWRQHRRQLFAATATLAVLAAVLLASGATMQSSYNSALVGCRAGVDCSGLPGSLFQTNWDRAVIVLAVLTLASPVVLAVFWGAPLLAGEAEEGTIKLAWTQSVSRRRWFLVKAGGMLAAAAAGGAAIGGLVSWWARPINALHHDRFGFGQFDVQGIAPIGYAVFAVALGIACGVWLRRTFPALGVTLVGFIAVRFGIAYGLRPHYMTPLTLNQPFSQKTGNLGGSPWVVNSYLISPAGRVVHGIKLLPGACPAPQPNNVGPVTHCLASLGWRNVTVYQPGGRYWAFQGIETGIYLVLAGIAIGVAYLMVTRRDA